MCHSSVELRGSQDCLSPPRKTVGSAGGDGIIAGAVYYPAPGQFCLLTRQISYAPCAGAL